MEKTCKVINCDRKIRVIQLELCLKHYQNFKKYGDATMLQKSVWYDDRAKKHIAQVTFNKRLVLFDSFKTKKTADSAVNSAVIHCNKHYFNK